MAERSGIDPRRRKNRGKSTTTLEGLLGLEPTIVSQPLKPVADDDRRSTTRHVRYTAPVTGPVTASRERFNRQWNQQGTDIGEVDTTVDAYDENSRDVTPDVDRDSDDRQDIYVQPVEQEKSVQRDKDFAPDVR